MGMDVEPQFGYLPVREAAKRAGVTEDWIRKLCRRGDLVCMKVSGAWFVFPGSFEAWLHSDRRPGRPLKGRGKVKGRQAVMDLDSSD